MKRVICFSALILLAGVNFHCKKDKAVARRGIINFMAGDVQLVKQGKKTAAKVGDFISGEMKIVTGKQSAVDVYFGENVIKILENTVVEVKKLVKNMAKNSEDTELFVENGRVLSKITKKLAKQDSYKIVTPTTVAAVRGTDFLISEQNGKSNIACLDGKVAVRDASKPDSEAVELNSGEEVDVEQGKELTVKSLSEQNKQNIQDILNEIKEMREDIKKKFIEQREEIRKAVDDQKELNKKTMDDQKNMNKENIENVKGSTQEDIKKNTEAVDQQKDESKKAFDSVKPDMDSIKPKGIEKPKLED